MKVARKFNGSDPAPLTAEQVAARFRGAGRARGRLLMETLAGLGVLRVTETGQYAS